MNRILVGTMLEVATGRRTLEDFAALLRGRAARAGRADRARRTAWRWRASAYPPAP